MTLILIYPYVLLYGMNQTKCSLCGIIVKSNDERIVHLKGAHDIEVYGKAKEYFE